MALYLVKLRAIRSLTGDYGRVEPGGTFTTDSRTAERLESRGLAERFRPPEPLPTLEEIQRQIAQYRAKAIAASPENKAIIPEENKQDESATFGRRRKGRR
jgi:hypothetical protein